MLETQSQAQHTPPAAVRRTRRTALLALVVGVAVASFAAGMTWGSPGPCSNAPVVIISPTTGDGWMPAGR